MMFCVPVMDFRRVTDQVLTPSKWRTLTRQSLSAHHKLYGFLFHPFLYNLCISYIYVADSPLCKWTQFFTTLIDYQFTLNGVLRLAYILNSFFSFSFLCVPSLLLPIIFPHTSAFLTLLCMLPYLPFYLNLWRYRSRGYIWRVGVKYRLHGPVCGNWISSTKLSHAKHTTCARSRFSKGNSKTRRQPSSVYFIFKPQILFSTVVVG